jgi:protein disulfide-isomerase
MTSACLRPAPPARRAWLATALAAASALVLGASLVAPRPAFASSDAKPYDEAADADAAVRAGLADAKAAHVPLLVVFGANWCKDCRALDTAMKTGDTAELMARHFRVVKVDVGNFDHNLALDQAYGHPIGKGIPAAVLLSPDNQVLYATCGGELADARHMSDTGIHDFFLQAVQAHGGMAAAGR